MQCNTNEKTEYISRFEQTKRNKRKKQPFRAISDLETKYTVTLNKLNVKQRKEEPDNAINRPTTTTSVIFLEYIE